MPDASADQSYLKALTEELRPKYGPDFAPRLAQAYVDFSNDRAPSAASDEARRIYDAEAAERFRQRVRAIKTEWEKGEN